MNDVIAIVLFVLTICGVLTVAVSGANIGQKWAWKLLLTIANWNVARKEKRDSSAGN